MKTTPLKPLIPFGHPIEKVVPDIRAIPRMFQRDALELFERGGDVAALFSSKIEASGSVCNGRLRWSKGEHPKNDHFLIPEQRWESSAVIEMPIPGRQYHRPKIYNENWTVGCNVFD